MNSTKLLLTALAALGIAGAGYLVVRQKEEQDNRNEIVASANDGEKARIQEIVNKMSYSELSDTLQLLRATKAGKQITDPALKLRLEKIGRKYDIFT